MEESKRPLVCPQLRQLESWSLERNIACSATSEEMWEISSPSEHSLSWSIVLSYVISMDKETLRQQFQHLLGNIEEMKEVLENKKIPFALDLENEINNKAMQFNPFTDPQKFYSNAIMIELIRIFHDRLNLYANGQKEVSWGGIRKLEAASRMLKCQIRVYGTDQDEKRTSHIFPKERGAPYGNGEIVIFQHSNVSTIKNINDTFAFGMTNNHALSLRKDALRNILEVANIHRIYIKRIGKFFKCNENFLHFLLKNSMENTIPNLYRSEILLKLAEAGFNTDPCCLGPEGLSAFYYCIELSLTDSLRSLYNYASNGFLRKTTRNLGSTSLTAVKIIAKVIKEDFKKSRELRTFENRRDIENHYRQILKFNEFQTDVLEEMCGILGEDYESSNPEQSRTFLILLLSTYLNYFYFQSSSVADNSALFKEYEEFSYYYESLDSYTGLLFFDHILKSKCPENAAFIANAVMSLFLTLLGYNLSLFELSSYPLSFNVISFTERLKFQHSCTALLGELKNSANLKEPEAQKRVIDIKRNLSEIVEINDTFVLYRLRNYLKEAASVSLDSCKTKGVLTIERSLQVIGESLTTSSNGNSMLKIFLRSCLPKNVLLQLFTIRNHCLSKYRTTMYGRLISEGDVVRFKKYQQELKYISCLFKTVYPILTFQVEEFMIKRCKNDARNFSNEIYHEISKDANNMKIKKKIWYKIHQSGYRKLVYYFLKSIQDVTKEDKIIITSDLNDYFKGLRFLFQNIANIKPEFYSILDSLDLLENLMITKTYREFEDDKKIMDIITDLHDVLKDIFEDIRPEIPIPAFKFPELCSYYEVVRKAPWFSDAELVEIKDEVVKEFGKSIEELECLKLSLREKTPPSLQDVEMKLKGIFINEKYRKRIVTKYVKNFKTMEIIINEIIEKYTKAPFSNLDELIKFIEEEEYKNLVLKTTFSSTLNQKIVRFMNRKIICLQNRIKNIKQILIYDDEDISSKWTSGNKVQKYTKFLMTQRFINKIHFRASLEMLLFDCYNILSDRNDLKELWTKANNLFSGVNLRDILSHGNTILENIGSFLDPEDLPNEFIDKMLELITDGDAIEAIFELSDKLKCTSKQLCDAINRNDVEQNVIKKIKSSCRWKSYLELITFKNWYCGI